MNIIGGATPPVNTKSDADISTLEVPEFVSTITIGIMLIILVAIIAFVIFSYIKKE